MKEIKKRNICDDYSIRTKTNLFLQTGSQKTASRPSGKVRKRQKIALLHPAGRILLYISRNTVPIPASIRPIIRYGTSIPNF